MNTLPFFSSAGFIQANGSYKWRKWDEKVDGNNNGRVDCSISCSGYNSNGGVKDVLKCWVKYCTCYSGGAQ